MKFERKLLFRWINMWQNRLTKFKKCDALQNNIFLFISLLAQRNEPKTRSAAKSHEVQWHPGVIVIRSHGAISREFQTQLHTSPYEIPVREMSCSTGDFSWDEWGRTPLQNALRDVECERPEMQPDALRPLHFSEQARRAGKSILSGERLFLFSIFFFWP